MIGCDKCEGRGYIHINSVEVATCECTKRNAIYSHFLEAGIPKKLSNFTIEDWNTKQDSSGKDLTPKQISVKKAAFDVVYQIYKNSKFPFSPMNVDGASYSSLILTGPRGSGKSFVLSILAKRAIKQGGAVKYYDWFDLAMSLDRYDNKSELDQIVMDFEEKDLILIDGIEKITLNNMPKNQLARIFKKRYNDNMLTICTTNDVLCSDNLFPGWCDFCEDSLTTRLL